MQASELRSINNQLKGAHSDQKVYVGICMIVAYN